MKKVSVDPQERRILQSMQDDSFSEEAFNAGQYDLTEKEKELAGTLPVSLILNKIDLVTNKKKLRSLQSELEDLCPFE